MFSIFAETQTIMPGKLASISIITIICLAGCGASVETGSARREAETEVYLFTADVFGAEFKNTDFTD